MCACTKNLELEVELGYIATKLHEVWEIWIWVFPLFIETYQHICYALPIERCMVGKIIHTHTWHVQARGLTSLNSTILTPHLRQDVEEVRKDHLQSVHMGMYAHQGGSVGGREMWAD